MLRIGRERSFKRHGYQYEFNYPAAGGPVEEFIPGQFSGGRMADYRAFLVNDERHIEQREDFAARDDEAALEHAKQWSAGDLTVEVWSQGIFVGTVRPVSQRNEMRTSRHSPRL